MDSEEEYNLPLVERVVVDPRVQANYRATPSLHPFYRQNLSIDLDKLAKRNEISTETGTSMHSVTTYI